MNYEEAAEGMERALEDLGWGNEPDSEEDSDPECSEEYSFRVEEFIHYRNGYNTSIEYKQTLIDAGRGHLC
jgi:hypothetical protein